MKKIIFLLASALFLANSNADINITGTRISAACQKIATQKAFQYYAWAGPCPAYSRAQALDFLKRYDIVQDALPACNMPTTPPLGETLSQPIPEGYELTEENITQRTQLFYDGYGKYSSNSGDTRAGDQGVAPAAQGIRTNARITGGGCSGLSAWIHFTSDEYGGVITTERFTRRYQKICLDNTDFPILNPDQNVTLEWSTPDNNETQLCDSMRGTVQERIQDCNSTYRCVVTKGCDQDNTSFPALQEGESVSLTWGSDENKKDECDALGGIIQEERKSCITEYRCVTKEGCTDENIPFPVLPEDKKIEFEWIDTDTAKNTECAQMQGEVQHSRNVCVDSYRCVVDKCTEDDIAFTDIINYRQIFKEWDASEDTQMRLACDNENNTMVQTGQKKCKPVYRCIQKTDVCPIEDDVPISSYVSPRDGVFHEDIEVTGADFSLHYSSANVDDTTIAHGWSISSYARLEGSRVYYGSGSIYAVEPVDENGNQVVTSGSNELLFDSEGKLQQVRDLYTKETKSTFSYDNVGRLVTLTDMYGEISTIERDANGTVTAIVAPTGQRTLLSIDAEGDLAEVQYEDTSSYAFEYERHLMTVETEPKGNRFLHFYDDAGKVVKVIDAEQAEWNFGSASTESYGSHTVTRASGDVIVYKNHFLENNTTLTTEKLLPTGDTITYTNTIDDSQSTTTSCGMQTTNLYKKNTDGTLYKDPYTNRRVLESTTVTTPAGLSKTTHYTTHYTQDANNTLISVTHTTETNGAVTTSLRDYNQSTQTTISPEGRVSSVTYNLHQQPIQTQYANLKPVSYSYNAQGKLLESKQGKRIIRYTYNDKGNIEEIHNVQRDTKTTYTYDNRDRLTQITYPDNTIEAFNYDANGNLITRTVPTPADHTFSYNGVNKRTGYTSPLQKTTTYSYDEQRRITKVTKPSQKSIDTTYNNGRVTSITTPEGTTNYSYTCQNNIQAITKPSTGSGTDKSFSFTYDGTLLTSMVQSGVLEETQSFSYDNDFRVVSFTYADKTENYSYDKDGLLIQSGDFTLTRDSINAQVTKLTDGTYSQKRRYNNYGEVKNVKDDVFEYALKRDKTKIKSKKETVTKQVPKNKGKGFKKVKETTNYAYVYDNRDRLVEVKKGKKKNRTTVEEYSYDSNGNRASATVYGVTTAASYTLDDNLIVYGDNTYLYDDDGYLQEKTIPQGTTTYNYGTRGELREVTLPTSTGSVTVSYQHNALNQRVAKLINGEVVEKYLWADLTTLLAIYDEDDNLVQRFEYADGRMPVAMTDTNGTKYYLHYDQVGSLRAVSDTSHNVIKEITYDTFGNILTDSNPSFKVPFGFAGGLYDPDTKLTRFGYRDYDAYTGKWTAKDPIGFDGGDSNLYGYVLGDPVGGFDPSGLVDLNLFKPGSYAYYLAIQHGLSHPGYTVGGHGTPLYDQRTGQGKDLSAADLAKLMKENGYSEGPVSLLSCNTGTSYDGESSYAQKLARELGATVYAPTSNYNYGLFGSYSTGNGNGLTPFYPWN